jgi:hypothetical protein
MNSDFNPYEFVTVPNGWACECLSDCAEDKNIPYGIVQPSQHVSDVIWSTASGLSSKTDWFKRIKPNQENRAFDVLKKKFYCKGGREKVGQDFDGWGLKIFPNAESEKPR